MAEKPVTAAEARRIAHEVVGMHVNHKAPYGHKGFGAYIERRKAKRHASRK